MANQSGIIIEEVTDPTELVAAHARDERFETQLSLVSVARCENLQQVSG